MSACDTNFFLRTSVESRRVGGAPRRRLFHDGSGERRGHDLGLAPVTLVLSLVLSLA